VFSEVVILKEEVSKVQNYILFRVELVWVKELVFDNPPEGLYLAVRLRPVGSGIDVFNA